MSQGPRYNRLLIPGPVVRTGAVHGLLRGRVQPGRDGGRLGVVHRQRHRQDDVSVLLFAVLLNGGRAVVAVAGAGTGAVLRAPDAEVGGGLLGQVVVDDGRGVVVRQRQDLDRDQVLAAVVDEAGGDLLGAAVGRQDVPHVLRHVGLYAGLHAAGLERVVDALVVGEVLRHQRVDRERRLVFVEIVQHGRIERRRRQGRRRGVGVAGGGLAVARRVGAGIGVGGAGARRVGGGTAAV